MVLDLDTELPYRAGPRDASSHFPPSPDQAKASTTAPSVDMPTALARAHETISLLCDELDQTREHTEPEPVSPSNFQAVRQDRDVWRGKHHLLSAQHARVVEQRDELEHELCGLKQALAVLAGSADE